MASGPRDRRAWVIVSALAALVVLALASSTRVPGVITEVRDPGSFDPPWKNVLAQSGDAMPSTQPSFLPSMAPASSGWSSALGYLLTGLLIAAGVGLVAAIIIQTVRAIRQRHAPEQAIDSSGDSIDLTSSHVRETLDESLTRLRHGDDAAATIIECWRRLEEAAATGGTERAPSQTAEEFTLALLGASTTLSEDDLRSLADLYRTAMFASVPPGEDGRLEAIAVLERLVIALGSNARSPQ